VEVLAADAADALERATGLLDEGELVLLPVDGAYALCADALSDEAAMRLADALGWSADQPLPVLVAGIEDARHVAFPTRLAQDLAGRFWPGPLAIRLRAQAWVPDEVTGGQGVVALRSPAVEVARRLARRFGPLCACDADASVQGHARLKLDAGERAGAPETLVDATGEEAKVLREGAVRAAEVVARGR
jgi:L-threonylcarbamoyladenylate synthase